MKSKKRELRETRNFYMLVDDSWAFAFSLAAAVGSITTAVALYFLWTQSRHTQKQIELTQHQIQLTKEEMESTVRPWVGIGNVGINDRYYITIELKNHGSIPAKVLRSNELFSPRKITQAELLSSEYAYGHEYLIFPGSTVTHVSKRNISMEVEGQEVKFVGISIEYEFAKNKRVQCGFIARYHHVATRFGDFVEFTNDVKS